VVHEEAVGLSSETLQEKIGRVQLLTAFLFSICYNEDKEENMKDLKVVLENRPGTLADLGEALGKAGINIEGGCGFPCEGQGVAHILIEDPVAARRVIEGVGNKVLEERDVLVLDIEDKPGALGQIGRRIASAGVNIDLVYLATNSRMVLGVDDLDKAHGAVG
jgi:hypothetical protein